MATQDSLYTMVTLLVNQDSYNILQNFCEDYDIHNVPLRKNMFFEVGTIKGVHKKSFDNNKTLFYMSDLELTTDNSADNETTILLLTGVSPPLEALFDDTVGNLGENEKFNDEPLVGVVLSYDFDDTDVDLEKLERKLIEYTGGVIGFSEFHVRYETEDDIFEFIMDGKEPGVDE